MGMLGQGLLLVLTDVVPESEDEFNRWYDTEHMKERVDIPGFLAARRYRSASGARRYCALYETDDVGVFETDEYRRCLAQQSDWSRRIFKCFVDPHRAIGNISASLGYGSGGTLALLKLPKETDSKDFGQEWARSVMPKIAALPGVISVHLFESVPRLSGPVAEYPATLRPLMNSDDRILLVEGTDAAILDKHSLEAQAGTAIELTEHLGVYDLTWSLSKRQLPAATGRGAPAGAALRRQQGG